MSDSTTRVATGLAATAPPPQVGSVPALEAVSGPTDALLERFLADRVGELTELDPALKVVGTEIAAFVAASGKRLRPAFVYWGHRATGAAHDDGVLVPAAAVELLHTFALIHDDIMDRSPQRRGRPAVHEALRAAHADDGLRGDAPWFGVGGAILAGDLAFVWADQLIDSADLPPAALDRARRVFTALRVEVMAGQYLDLRLAGLRSASEEESRRVALLKSGRYTVTRPLQLGAAIAGENPELDGVLRGYGDAVGLAFQLRDDVLSLFGDPTATGKGAMEDLREGKRTLLILQAFARCSAADRMALEHTLGNPRLNAADADRARSVIVGCGALDAVERVVSEQHDRACLVLDRIGQPARDALEQLAGFAAFRSV
ncbi:MAG: polyprenyl synthetase family protein [Actinomycetota bacterium]|nr:polyprenyl synthetase family protein [Actinomycetota bacterium]